LVTAQQGHRPTGSGANWSRRWEAACVSG